MTTATIAINIALLPDAGMVARAKAMNARIRENYPESFALDEEHLVHITLGQAFVDGGEIAGIWRKVKSLAVRNDLRASSFDFHANGEMGTAGYDISLTPWLRETHAQVAAAVAPFSLPDGDENAFFTAPGESAVGERSVNYVKDFFRAYGGSRYNPHVTLGIGQREFLELLRNMHFEPFEFGVEALVICQLGDNGTCRRVLCCRRLAV
ncbi:hypothetical protein F6455_10055 [Proteobacteria bacterium 005FR1]|nr:hypothetical protein [Proteobacteria bacterium 005FR1]